MHNPHIDHCNVVARTFRYVQKALGQGLLYEGKEYIQIFGYCDADGVGWPIDRDPPKDIVYLFKGISSLGIRNKLFSNLV